MNIGNSATTGGGIRHRNGSRNFADMAADVVMAAEAVTSSSSNVSMTLAVTTAVGGGQCGEHRTQRWESEVGAALFSNPERKGYSSYTTMMV